jgi:hypothetical protein
MATQAVADLAEKFWPEGLAPLTVTCTLGGTNA